MRINVDATTVLLVGAAAYLWWRVRQSGVALGGPSDELMGYAGEQVQPPIWDGWLSWGEQDRPADETTDDVAAHLQRRFESGSYGSL